MKPGTIRIYESTLKRPILETSDARIVEFYDRFGKLNAILTRQFEDDMWMLVSRKDPDWESNLIRLGYLDPNISKDQLIGKLKELQ